MSYNAFLLVMSQLAGNRKARVATDDHTIYFEKTSKNRLTLKTAVFSGEGFVPHRIRDCVSGRGNLQWQQRGPSLKLDLPSHSVILCEEIEMEEGKFLPFRHHFAAFSAAACEWKKFLGELAEGEYSRKTL